MQAKWSAITDFGKATHPTNVTESMQPILGNLGTAKGKGGNQFIDVDEALGYELPPVTTTFDERDLSLYALGVGAAKDPLDAKELSFVYEMSGDGFKMLPTFPVAPALRAIFDLAKEGKQAPGLHYGFDRVLHGEQYTEIRAPWPTHGKLTHKIKIKDIFDKGKGALVISAITTTDENGHGARVQRDDDVRARRGRLGRRARAERRGERPAEPRARRGRRGEDQPEPGAALPPLGRLEPAARGPGVREELRLRPAHPPRALHVRLRRRGT